MGLYVTSKMSFIEFILDVVSTASISGIPLEVESVRELDQKPSKLLL